MTNKFKSVTRPLEYGSFILATFKSAEQAEHLVFDHISALVMGYSLMQLKRSALFEDMQYPQRYFLALLKKLDRHNTIGLTRAPQD